jgi:hypothetical protein
MNINTNPYMARSHSVEADSRWICHEIRLILWWNFHNPPPPHSYCSSSTVFQYLPHIRQTQSTFLQILSLRFTLILPSKASLTRGFPTKIFCVFLIYLIHDARTAHLIILNLITPVIVTYENTLRHFLIMHLFLFPSYFVLLATEIA